MSFSRASLAPSGLGEVNKGVTVVTFLTSIPNSVEEVHRRTQTDGKMDGHTDGHTKRTINRSPKGNMGSAIPVALLCLIVNWSEGKQGSGPEGDKVL